MAGPSHQKRRDAEQRASLYCEMKGYKFKSIDHVDGEWVVSCLDANGAAMQKLATKSWSTFEAVLFGVAIASLDAVKAKQEAREAEKAAKERHAELAVEFLKDVTDEELIDEVDRRLHSGSSSLATGTLVTGLESFNFTDSDLIERVQRDNAPEDLVSKEELEAIEQAARDDAIASTGIISDVWEALEGDAYARQRVRHVLATEFNVNNRYTARMV